MAKDKELTEAEKLEIVRDPKKWEKFLADTQKLMKEVETQIAEKELDEETEKMRKLLEKQKSLLDLQEKQLKNELQIAEFKQKAKLPKTNVDARLHIINEVRAEILERRRELETEKTGLDPNPKFLGKSDDHLTDIYELYKTCGNCHKIFKTFKNETFCSSKCREQWVSENMSKEKPLIQEEFAERNNELWNWERIGSETTESLGTYGIFRKVWKDPK